MKETQIASYGGWRSPITSDIIVSESIRLGGARFDNENIYWLEGRPKESGRSVIVRLSPDKETTDVISQPFNARTRVHEYGGAAMAFQNGAVIFANFSDQRLYRVVPGGTPEPLTPVAKLRYADLILDAGRERLICVREDHRDSEEAVNTLVAVPLDGHSPQQVLVSGNDFYASPCLSPDGKQLAWLTWQHPNMPWDSSELWVAEVLADGELAAPHRVAGGENESIYQPAWSPEGVLYFVSDRSGWWNLYRWQDGRSVPLVDMCAEFGLPLWVFGHPTYAFVTERSIICTYTQNGTWFLAELDTQSGVLTPFDIPYTSIDAIQVCGRKVLFRGGSPYAPGAIVLLDLDAGTTEVLKCSSDVAVENDYFSFAEAIEFSGSGGEIAHAFYYAPKNPDYVAPEGEKPPLLVMSHGGPTAATSSTLNLPTQYWTSRGFAVLDVNYGGSTGYGRAYRERLNGRWGVVDIEDCVYGARYLVDQGLVDPARLAIRGGSAGGYTTLGALTFHDVFKAGASYYGVSDLESLAKDTHKFESRYLDGLVGPYPAERELYMERSPVNHVESLNCPVIFFQGQEDQVVPPSQTESMVEALFQKGIPVAYILFEGEQHGFRRAENIKTALDGELYFYSQIFAFPLWGEAGVLEIKNWETGAPGKP